MRHISCHLGGSSSLAAIRNGVAVDTSFGISAQSGIPHNNRCGDVDAFAALFAMKRGSLSVEEIARILASQSGLAGISGGSGDVRDLEAAAAAGDRRARLALDVFVRAVRHYLGAFLVELGGLDVLTFSGGIGENGVEIRAAVCRGLEAFGIRLDEEWNARARGEARISAEGSAVAVFVVPADEERIVARAAATVIQCQEIREIASGIFRNHKPGRRGDAGARDCVAPAGTAARRGAEPWRCTPPRATCTSAGRTWTAFSARVMS